MGLGTALSQHVFDAVTVHALDKRFHECPCVQVHAPQCGAARRAAPFKLACAPVLPGVGEAGTGGLGLIAGDLAWTSSPASSSPARPP